MDPVKIEVFRDGLPPSTAILFVVFFVGCHHCVSSRATDSSLRGRATLTFKGFGGHATDRDASLTWKKDYLNCTISSSLSPGMLHCVFITTSSLCTCRTNVDERGIVQNERIRR